MWSTPGEQWFWWIILARGHRIFAWLSCFGVPVQSRWGSFFWPETKCGAFQHRSFGLSLKIQNTRFFLCRYHCQLVSYTQYKGQSFLSSRFLFFLRCWQSSLILSHCIFESMKFSFCTWEWFLKWNPENSYMNMFCYPEEFGLFLLTRKQESCFKGCCGDSFWTVLYLNLIDW